MRFDPSDPWKDEVEPLSEARWGRIKRSLFDKLDEEGLTAPDERSRARGLRSPAWLVLGGVAAAAMGALASHALWRSPAPSQITASDSPAELHGRSADRVSPSDPAAFEASFPSPSAARSVTEVHAAAPAQGHAFTGTPARAPAIGSESPPPHAEPLPSAASEVRRTPQQRYESAAGLEATEPAAALAIYEDLAQGEGPWSANALFAAGRLEADRGAAAAARRLLEQYLSRFPRGPNAADARDLLGRMGPARP